MASRDGFLPSKDLQFASSTRVLEGVFLQQKIESQISDVMMTTYGRKVDQKWHLKENLLQQKESQI